MSHRDDLVAAYDAHAGERDERGEPDWRSPVRAAFAARLSPGARVLEIGAGVGYTAQWFAAAGFDVVATDLSPANVSRCAAKGVTALVRDMRALGFPDESFDAVWAASCLMHVPDVELVAVLEGIRDVLVPGGLFWAGTWGGDDVEGVWEDDHYEPKRFYSRRSDARLRSLYGRVFTVEGFDALDVEPGFAWHYQSAWLRRS